MIGMDEVILMGSLIKAHGVQGEMVLTVPETLDWSEDLDCLVCRIDGILIPFFIESLRPKSGTTMLVKFEDVDTVQATAAFIGLKVYMPRKYAIENGSDEPTWESFLEWKVVDRQAGPLGMITAVDDSTPNILFQVRDGDRERIIPANEDWITDVDRKHCILTFNLPQGLADL